MYMNTITSRKRLNNNDGNKNFKPYFILCLFLANIIFCVTPALSQIPNCSANVPTYNVDFTGNPAGTFTTPNVSRTGNCCGTSSPDRCLHFSITLDTADVAVNFQITSGAIPPGA